MSTSTTYIPARPGGMGLRKLVSNWSAAARARRERRIAISVLRGMNRQTLKDIGIDRSEITSIVHSAPANMRQTHGRH